MSRAFHPRKDLMREVGCDPPHTWENVRIDHRPRLEAEDTPPGKACNLRGENRRAFDEKDGARSLCNISALKEAYALAARREARSG